MGVEWSTRMDEVSNWGVDSVASIASDHECSLDTCILELGFATLSAVSQSAKIPSQKLSFGFLCPFLSARSSYRHLLVSMALIKCHLMVVLMAVVLLALVHTSTSADACNVHHACDKCTEVRGCNWCWDGAHLGCHRVIDPVQCCTRCDECEEKIRFKTLSLGLMVSLLIGSVAILFVAIGYSYYRYYWTKRHFFEVLE